MKIRASGEAEVSAHHLKYAQPAKLVIPIRRPTERNLALVLVSTGREAERDSSLRSE